MRLGLKLWSINDNYRECAETLFSGNVYDYIELMVVPGSAADAAKWASSDAPFILHAPHGHLGMNLAVPGKIGEKKTIFEEIEIYRRILGATRIIFHPGLDGTCEQFIQQFARLSEPYPEISRIALIENKPAVGLNNERCVGSSPGEIAAINAATKTGFCLDIGHAVCFANFANRDWKQLLDEFITLKPAVFHLSDGQFSSKKDMHLNYGRGNFDLDYIIRWLPKNATVSLETGKSSDRNLDDFVRDAEFIKTRMVS